MLILLCVDCGQWIFSCGCRNRACFFEHAIWAVCSHLTNPVRSRKWFKPVLLVYSYTLDSSICVNLFLLYTFPLSLTHSDLFLAYHGFSFSSCSSFSCWRLCIQLLSPFRAVRTFVVLKTDCLSPSTNKNIRKIFSVLHFYNSERKGLCEN